MLINKKDNQRNVYAVVVTYNGSRWIGECIESLLASQHPVKIIVIDNCSTDNTVDIINSYPNVILKQPTKNLGFGQANNIGIAFALKNNADFVLLLNQDAKIEKNAIHFLVEVASKNADYGLFTPVHLNYTGSRYNSSFLRRYIGQNSVDYLSDVYHQDVKNLYKIPRINAAAWFLSRSCLEAVGGFDPLFFMYGEDDNLASRIKFHGFNIGLISNSVIYHNDDDSLKDKTITAKASSHQFIKKRASRLRSIMLVSLLDLNSSFKRNLWRWFFGCFCETASDFIVKLDMKQGAARMYAMFFIIVNINKIARHHAASRLKSRLWLGCD